MTRPLPATRNSLADGIAALAKEEGHNATCFEGAVVYRVTKHEPAVPTLYPASIILVGAGEKRATLGTESIAYNARHYLVVSSPLPMLCRTLASPENPLLSLVVHLDPELLRELLAEIGDPPEPVPAREQRSSFGAPLTPALEDAGCRLLVCLRDERKARALARQTVREIIFHVLDGPNGSALHGLAHGPRSQLNRVMRYVNERYAERMSVEELARMAHMSVPTFHQHFKAMTSKSPLQYIKAIRLTRARQLLQSGASVKSAGHDVGYESESQFSREFTRFYGAAPSTFIVRAVDPRLAGRRVLEGVTA